MTGDRKYKAGWARETREEVYPGSAMGTRERGDRGVGDEELRKLGRAGNLG